MEEQIDLQEKEFVIKSKPGQQRVFNRELKRVDFCDFRCYQRAEGLYYPSVTSILSALPPSNFFLDWIKETGFNADIIRDKAAREGTQVHEGIERLLKGEQLDWVDEYGNARYSLNVWKMLLRFQDFYNTVKPKTLASEMFLYSDTYQYAGTTDYLCSVEVPDIKETWLLDFKSSNHIGLSYNLQLSAYGKALEEMKGIKADRHAVLWLKASTRSKKFDIKKGVCQGEGWQLIFDPDPKKSFEIFEHVYAIYKALNPKIEPYSVSYPTEISISI